MFEQLKEAIKRSDKELCKELLHATARSERDEEEWERMIVSTCQDDTKSPLLSLLLQSRFFDVNASVPSVGPPLYVSSSHGSLKCLEVLLSNDLVDLNFGLDGDTPLRKAARNGHSHIVSALLSHPETDVNKRSSHGDSPLFIAAHYGHTEVVRALIQRPELDVNLGYQGWSPICRASRKGHWRIVELLKNDIRTNINQDCNGYTALRRAARKGHTKVVRMLLSHPLIDVNHEALHGEGGTALYVACEYGFKEIAASLLSHPAITVFPSSRSGLTPYQIAVKSGHLDIAALFPPSLCDPPSLPASRSSSSSSPSPSPPPVSSISFLLNPL